jgi:hypothetical protein
VPLVHAQGAQVRYHQPMQQPLQQQQQLFQ